MEIGQPASGKKLAVAAAALLLGALGACSDDGGSMSPERDLQPVLDRSRPPADGAGLDQAQDSARVTDWAQLGDAPHAGCRRLPGPDDRPRKVVVSHPILGPGQKSPSFEVLELSTQGLLAQTGVTFDLAVASTGKIHFTPDGKIGLVVVEGGGLGVFELQVSGQVRVVHAPFSGSFYASSLVMDPRGDRAYVLSSQWRESGGGIYEVGIRCDGTLEDRGLLQPAKLPYALALVGGQPAGAGPTTGLLVARDVLQSAAGDDVHLLQWDPQQLLDGADAFGDDEAIVSAAALAGDARYLLLADDSMFPVGGAHRVAVVEVLPDALQPLQVLSPFADPADLVASPFGMTTLVLEAGGNAISVLAQDPQSATPRFANLGPLATSSTPQLPTVAAMIRRGSLEGRVIIAETLALRQVQFQPDGSVSEVQWLSLGKGNGAIVGAIGVQP